MSLRLHWLQWMCWLWKRKVRCEVVKGFHSFFYLTYHWVVGYEKKVKGKRDKERKNQSRLTTWPPKPCVSVERGFFVISNSSHLTFSHSHTLLFLPFPSSCYTRKYIQTNGKREMQFWLGKYAFHLIGIVIPFCG